MGNHATSANHRKPVAGIKHGKTCNWCQGRENLQPACSQCQAQEKCNLLGSCFSGEGILLSTPAHFETENPLQ